MVSDELIKHTHVQVQAELGCTGCSVKAGSNYFTMLLGSSVSLPARNVPEWWQTHKSTINIR